MGRHTGRQKAQELSDAGSNPVPWVGCQVAYFLGMTLRTRSAWSSLSLLLREVYPHKKGGSAMSDCFAGLQIYYVPTENDVRYLHSLPEGIERDRWLTVSGHRRVGYVLGRSEDQVIWVLDDQYYADFDHGLFELKVNSLSDFFEIIKAGCLKVVLSKRMLVSDSVLAGMPKCNEEDCFSPESLARAAQIAQPPKDLSK